MNLLVLGPGCPRCRKLAEVTEQAARELGVDYQIQKGTDLRSIIARGIMMTPALVVDGAVRVAGRVPSVEELKQLLLTPPTQPPTP